MFKTLFVAIALTIGLFSSAQASTSSSYRMNGSIRNLVNEYVDIPEVLHNANIKVVVTAYPKSRYYKTEITLLQPYNRLCGLTKTLEVWDDKQIVRTSVDVNLNIRCKLLKRIIEPRIEQAILAAEKSFLKSKISNFGR